jgi:hypothetical protein
LDERDFTGNADYFCGRAFENLHPVASLSEDGRHHAFPWHLHRTGISGKPTTNERSSMSLCTQCHAPFVCRQADPNASGACWCAALPVVPRNRLLRGAEDGLLACLCPDCLRTVLAQSGILENQAQAPEGVTDNRASPGEESQT